MKTIQSSGNSKKILEWFQFAVLIALLALAVLGVLTAITVQAETREHYRIAKESEDHITDILEGRSACIIPKETVEEAIQDAGNSAEIR